jgi:hypothetical protein
MNHNLIALGIFASILVVLFVLRQKIGVFISTTIFFVIACVYLSYGIDPPIPSSIITLFVVTTLIAMLLYVTSSKEAANSFFGPIIRVMVEEKLKYVRIAMLIIIPAVISWRAWEMAQPDDTPPAKVRMVHPPPPSTLSGSTHGDTTGYALDMQKDDNPYRPLETSNPELFKEHVTNGKRVYYQNCYYCHGDTLAADGHYANAVIPIPANFMDTGTIAMLTETFVFWRIAKGGPGLPPGSTPWDSSMPVWEDMLSLEEMWDVTLFLYDYTGYKPRGKGGDH